MGHPGDLRYAAELIEFIRSEHGDAFHIEVGAYPETHPQASDALLDLQHFKAKVDAGADGAITQYFYNADAYFSFVEAVRKLGVEIPIVPGIMPISNFSQLRRFSEQCGAEIPRWISKRMQAYGDDVEAVRELRRRYRGRPVRTPDRRRRALAALLHAEPGQADPAGIAASGALSAPMAVAAFARYAGLMPPRLLVPLLLSCLLGLLPAMPARAQADVHRCIGADGQAVFSDRRCEDLDATSRMPPPALRDSETGLYRYGCPRRLSELVGLLRTAVEAHDVNRPSSLYLWGEVSDATANRVLSQLEAIAERPLLDIAPMYPEAPAEPYTPAPVPDPALVVAVADPPTYSPPDNSAAAAVTDATGNAPLHARGPGACAWNKCSPTAARLRAPCCAYGGSTTASG